MMTPIRSKKGVRRFRLELAVNGGQLRDFERVCRDRDLTHECAFAEMIEDFVAKVPDVPLPGMRIWMEESTTPRAGG